jgi:glycosyltransferase involved in cell wall biosynthesis
MKSHPTITVIIPVKNEEKNITQCLRSIFSQVYPKDKLTVLVVDDSSTDNTVTLAKKYPVKLLTHNYSDPEVGKMIAFKTVKTKYCMYLDADIHLRGNDWFQKMILPLESDPQITASFTKYYSDQHSTMLEKYLNIDPLQRDVIYQYFSPSISQVTTKKNEKYALCEYTEKKIPPAGLCLHRTQVIKRFLSKNRFLELDLLVKLVLSGNRFFAYVPTAGLYHHHVTSLMNLLKKRSRNVTSVYLKDNDTRVYRWFDLKSFHGVMKLFLWVVGAHLIFPLLVNGVIKSIVNRTWVGLYDPIVGLLATDVIIISFLKDSRGRKLITS